MKRYGGEFDNGRNAVRHTKLLLLAMVAAACPSLSSAQELRPVVNPELGFSSARLQSLTETYEIIAGGADSPFVLSLFVG